MMNDLLGLEDLGTEVPSAEERAPNGSPPSSATRSRVGARSSGTRAFPTRI